MKPDWKDAPDWAKYLGQDGGSGEWWWYENRPRVFGSHPGFVADTGKIKRAQIRNHHWIATLEKRP